MIESTEDLSRAEKEKIVREKVEKWLKHEPNELEVFDYLNGFLNYLKDEKVDLNKLP